MNWEGDMPMERDIRRYWPVFLLPTMLAFAIGFLIPFVMGLYLSFCDFTTLSNATFVGFGNYVRAFEDSGGFTHALWFTALFAGLSTALINLFGLMVALLLVRGFKGTNVFRTVFFMPNLIGGIVLGWLWQVILNYGVLAPYGVTLVTSEWYGFWGLMTVMLWQQAGYMMIIYISGLQSIPGDVTEAAAIDPRLQLCYRFLSELSISLSTIAYVFQIHSQYVSCLCIPL